LEQAARAARPSAALSKAAAEETLAREDWHEPSEVPRPPEELPPTSGKQASRLYDRTGAFRRPEPPVAEVSDPDMLMQAAVLRSGSEPVSSASAGQLQAQAQDALEQAARAARPSAALSKAAAEEALARDDWRESEVPRPPDELPPISGKQASMPPLQYLDQLQRMPPPPASPPPLVAMQTRFAVGDKVILRGLVNLPHFNLRKGTVQRFDDSDGHYLIRIEDPDGGQRTYKKVLPENMEKAQSKFTGPRLDLSLAVDQAAPSSHRSGMSISSLVSPRGGVLKQLHFSEGSLVGKGLKGYCKQIIKRPKWFLTVYTLAVLVPVGVGGFFKGFELESDFGAFIRADGAAMREREAYLLAIDEKSDPDGKRRLSEVQRQVFTDGQREVHIKDWQEDRPPGRRLFKVGDDWVEEEEEIEEPRRLQDGTWAPGRRLAAMFIRKEIYILHETKQKSIFDEAVLREAADVEMSIRNLPSYQNACLNMTTSEAKQIYCNPGQSVLAFAYPESTTQESGKVLFELNFNGKGVDMLPPDAFLAYMKSEAEQLDPSRNSRRYFPSSFQYPELGSSVEDLEEPPKAIRTKWSFQLKVGESGTPMHLVKPEIEKVKEKWQEILKGEIYGKFNEIAARREGLNNFYWYNSDLDGYEVEQTLFRDLLMAIGSIAFVVFYLRLHTGSLLISVASFFIIFISVPVAYVLTPMSKTTMASFLSIFLITGIGCDVVFVFTDFWEQSKGRKLEDRLILMIVHAGIGCLATSITTALSFFANLASALQPLREFGMFMGLCVMCAYILVLLILPPLLVVRQKSETEESKSRIIDIASGQSGALSSTKKKKETAMTKLMFALSGWISACPCSILLVCLIFFIASVIGVISGAELSTGIPVLFPPEHNQVAGKEAFTQFSTEANLKNIPDMQGVVCRADLLGGRSAYCDLHWCEAVPVEAPPDASFDSSDEVTCYRSHLLRGDNVNIGYDKTAFEDCDQVEIVTLLGSNQASSRPFARTQLEMLNEEISASSWSREPTQDAVFYQQTPLVMEDWESGKATVVKFYEQSGSLKAFGPFNGKELPDWSASNGSIGHCWLHVLCSHGTEKVCAPNEWQKLGSSRYTLNTRLLAKQDEGPQSTPTEEDDETIYALSPLMEPMGRARRLQSPDEAGITQMQTVASAVDVTILWGIRAARYTPLVGAPSEFWSYDPTFEPSSPWAQRALRDMCTDMPEDLAIWKAKCWIHRFRDYLADRGKRFPSREFDTDVVDYFYEDSIKAHANLWFNDGKLVACKHQFWINVGKFASAEKGLEEMEKWAKYVDAKNAVASLAANAAYASGSVWVRSEAEKAIVGSTIDTIIIATMSGWVGVLVFTGDVWLAVLTTAVVLVVICGLAFFIVTLMGWAIGPIEVISLVVFVGYSVTYALHIAHNYNEITRYDADVLSSEEKVRRRKHEREVKQAKRKQKAANPADRVGEEVDAVELDVEQDFKVLPEDFTPQQIRQARTRVSILHVGGATLSSALSTAGSSAFLLFCTLSIFVKLGAVVVAVTTLSIAGAIIMLPAALILFGPAEDAWYKRKSRELVQRLTSRGREGQEAPLLPPDEEDEGEGEIVDEVGALS